MVILYIYSTCWCMKLMFYERQQCLTMLALDEVIIDETTANQVFDEDITPMYVAETPPFVIEGPITRACARQLHQQVSSFLSTRAYSCEDGILSKDIIDYIVLRNFGDDHEGLGDQQGPGGKQGGHPCQDGGQFNSDSTTSATRSRVH
jgi:hypothetical protein